MVASDLPALKRFTCTRRGARFGASDIERQVRSCKPYRRVQYNPDDRFLGMFDVRGRLIACAYHRYEALFDHVALGKGRYVMFLAVSDDLRRSRLSGSDGISDRMLRSTHDDIARYAPDTGLVAARVHHEHRASIDLLDRNGYVQVPTQPRNAPGTDRPGAVNYRFFVATL